MWRPLDIALVALIALVVLAPIAWRVVQRRFDPFEPIVFFAIAFGAMFVVRPAAMLIEGSLVYDSARDSFDVSSTFSEVLVLALCGAVAFVLGYALPLGSTLATVRRPPGVDPPERRLVASAVLVGLLGLSAYALALASAGLGDTLSAIFRSGNVELPASGSALMYGSYLFLLLVPASLLVLARGLEDRDTALVIVALVLGGIFCVFALPLGNRSALLPLIGGALVLWYVRRRARPSVPALALLAVAAFLGSTLLSDLRGRATRDETVWETVERATSPSRLADSVVRGPDTEMAPALAAALTVVPEQLGHGYGAVIFGDLLRRPIPRSLWEEKPLIPRHELIATLWPVEYERGTINTEFSVLLYFYWDFGLLGLIVGLAAYGLLARYFYERFLQYPDHLPSQVFFALGVWFVVIAVRDSPVDVVVRASFVLVPVWAIVALARLSLGSGSTRLPRHRPA